MEYKPNHTVSIDGDTIDIRGQVRPGGIKDSPPRVDSFDAVTSTNSGYNIYRQSGNRQISHDGDSVQISTGAYQRAAGDTQIQTAPKVNEVIGRNQEWPMSTTRLYNTHYQSEFQQKPGYTDTVQPTRLVQREAAAKSQTHHLVGYAEANTGLTTWSSDNIPMDSALRFYSFVSGIGDIKNDLKTFHSNASTGEKIKAGLDIAVQAGTDISLADGVGEALRVGEVGEKVLAKLTEQEAETVTEKTADLGTKGTVDVSGKDNWVNVGSKDQFLKDNNYSADEPYWTGDMNKSILRDSNGNAVGEIHTGQPEYNYNTDPKTPTGNTFPDHFQGYRPNGKLRNQHLYFTPKGE